MQQRYYDPLIARFLSRDSVTAYQKPLTNFNAYVYALNNPYRFSDPDGRDSASCYSNGGCGGNNSFYVSQEKLGELADFTPVVGDVKGFVDAYNDPSAINVAAAIAGLAPVVGDFAGKGLRAAARMANVARLGREGEAAAGIVKNTLHIPSATGTAAYRIPDGLTRTTLTEVKNYSGTLRLTNQIKDFMSYAKDNKKTFELVIGKDTKLSDALQKLVDSGDITLRQLK